MAPPNPSSPYSAANRNRALAIAAGATVGIALLDSWAMPQISLGFLYLYPIILAGGFLARWQVLPLALLCALLAEIFYPAPWSGSVEPRIVITVAGFTVAGLFAAQLGRNRRRLMVQLHELETQIKLRQEAEEELRVLIETSAAAIVTVDADGRILQSNRAAERILNCEQGPLQGQAIASYLPFLSGIQARAQKLTPFRTMVEGRGHRRDGSAFFAQVWLSTYRTTSGPRLAAIIWDASEQVREREELGLRQLLTSSRIFMGAISHEVRNLCAAISVVHLNLSKNSEFAENPDFQALGSLVESLRQLASSELRSATEGDLSSTDLRGLLEELGIIAGPSAEELEAEIDWEIPEELPFVRADRSALLQVLLNLLNNGLRAVRAQQERRISVVVYALQDSVVVRICNRGPVIEAPQDLFQPFQSGADATGLGLYVSRAIVRTFGGELRYTSKPNRHCFLVELMSAPAHEGPRG